MGLERRADGAYTFSTTAFRGRLLRWSRSTTRRDASRGSADSSLPTPPEERSERIFDIVSQLNRGAPWLSAQDERDEFAELNLIAGIAPGRIYAYPRRSRTSSPARRCWPEALGGHPRPRVRAGAERAECEFLTGDRNGGRSAWRRRKPAPRSEDRPPSRVFDGVYTTLGCTDVPSRWDLDTSGISESTGRPPDGQEARRNTRGSGPNSAAARSRSSSISP